MENKKIKKLSTDTLLFALSNFSSKLLVFFLLPFYTSLLSTTEMGIIDLITNVVNVAFPILTLSLIEALLRFSFEKEENKKQLFSNAIKICFVGEGILLLLTPIANSIDGIFFDYWLYFSLLFLGFSLSNTVSNYLKGCNKTKAIAIHGVIQTAFTVSLNVLLIAVLKKGIQGYLLSLIISYFTSTLIITVFTKIYCDFELRKTDYLTLKKMVVYSLPIIPSKIAWWLNNYADRYFLISMMDVSVSGLYSVAHKIPSIITTLSDIFNQAWQLSAIDTYVNDGKNDDFYNSIHSYFIQFVVLVSSFVVIVSELLGKMFFRGEFFGAWIFVSPLVVSSAFAALSGFYHSIFRAAMMSKELTYSVGIGTVVNIILNFFLIKTIGPMGTAYATMIAFIVEWVFSFYIAKKAVYLDPLGNVLFISIVALIIECIVMCNDLQYKYYYCSALVILIAACSISLIKKCLMMAIKWWKNR